MTITILPPAKTQFFNSGGAPLEGGSVYMYVPNTTTFKTTWQDPGGTIPNANPIILNGAGQAAIWGSGEYLQEVYDVNGNLQWTGLTLDPGYAIMATFNGTSTTSVSIGTGSKSFTTQPGLQFFPGGTVTIANSANGLDYMNGIVTSYNTATGALVVDALTTGGSGTFSSWNIAVSGIQSPGDTYYLPTIAALRANTQTGRPNIYITGWNTLNDGGEGLFVLNSADSTSSDNGGTIIVDAANNRWYRSMSNTECNAAWWGIYANSSTNSTTQIQAALNYVSSLGGGVVLLPTGEFNIQGGISVPEYCKLKGTTQGFQATSLYDNGANLATLITLPGTYSTLEDITVYGCGRAGSSDPLPSYPAVNIPNSNQDSCRLIRCTIQFGNPPLQVGTQDTLLDNCYITDGYNTGGNVVITGAGQVWAKRTSFDQSWPYAEPSAGTASPAVWTSSAVTTLGEVVSVGSYFLQCTAVTGNAETGSTAPTVLTYGSNIIDNHVTWQLAAPSGASAVWIGPSTTSENYFEQCDFSCCLTQGILIAIGASSGVYLGVNQCVIGQIITAAITAHVGAALFIENNELYAGYQSGSDVIYLPGPANSIINGNLIQGGNRAVEYGSAGSMTVNGNIFNDCTTGVYIDANINNFVVGNNIFNNCMNSITVATGSSDYFNIVNNIVNGNAVTNNGTGTHSTVTANH